MECDGTRRQDHLAPWRAPWTTVELFLSLSRRATGGPEVLAALGRPLSQLVLKCRWPAFRRSPSVAVGAAGLALLCSADPEAMEGSGLFHQHWARLGSRSQEAQISGSGGSHPQGLPSPFPQRPLPRPAAQRFCDSSKPRG